MPKPRCYFGCARGVPLHTFPRSKSIKWLVYQTERYNKWKALLDPETKEKGDDFILNNLHICNRHFADHFRLPSGLLTKNAVPSLFVGEPVPTVENETIEKVESPHLSSSGTHSEPTALQHKLLCKFIEDNPELVLGHTATRQMVAKIETKWKEMEVKLNAVGAPRSYAAWSQFLLDVKSTLKTEKVKWIKEIRGCGPIMPVVYNNDKFTELELRMLRILNEDLNAQQSTDNTLLDFQEEVNNIDIDESTGGEPANQIVTSELNESSEGQEPLIQVTEIPSDEAPCQQVLMGHCKCSDTPDEFDGFGNLIALHLRSLPAATALETKRLLMDVLQSKQRKIFHEHSYSIDPL